MPSGTVLTLSLLISTLGGFAAPSDASSLRRSAYVAPTTRSRSASDSVAITNGHPHPMRVSQVVGKEETELGIIPSGAVQKFAIIIPPGATELLLRASNAMDRSMTMDGIVPIVAGKPLAWTIGADGLFENLYSDRSARDTLVRESTSTNRRDP